VMTSAARCDRLGCIGRLADGAFVALVLDMEAFEEDCRRAALVITPLPAPAYCSLTAEVLDRTRLAASASLAVQRVSGRFDITPARPVDRWKPWYGRPRTQPATPRAATSPDPEPSQPAAPAMPDDGADLLTP
jgi:competence protein ComEC